MSQDWKTTPRLTRVVGEDAGERLYGVFMGVSQLDPDDGLVLWDGEVYDSGSRGHSVPLELLHVVQPGEADPGAKRAVSLAKLRVLAGWV